MTAIADEEIAALQAQLEAMLAEPALLAEGENDFTIENGTLTAYTGTDSAVTIPSGVTAIGDQAFQDCLSISSVVLPNTVTSIGAGAFAGCTRLKSISIPASVMQIGESVFYDDINLVANVYENSYAHSYCKQNSISYSLITASNPITPTPFPGQSCKQHKWVRGDVLLPATCTSGGLVWVVCSVCGERSSDLLQIPANGHDFSRLANTVREPSCTEDGLSRGSSCGVCGEVLVQQSILPATGHTEIIDPAVDADCTGDGLTGGMHCSACSAILIPQQVIPASGHSWKLTASRKAYVCSICGAQVSARPSRITIDAQNSMEITIGEEFTLDVVFSPENSYSPVRWTSSNKKVVSVDAGGAIAALKEGTATITAKTANGKRDTVRIRVI